MNNLNEVKIVFEKIPKSVLESNSRYFEKFLPVFEDIKDPCCLKHCIRSSGRYCNNCPNNPIRLSNIREEFLTMANSCLINKDYWLFIELLAENGFPYPDTNELSNLE